MGDCGCGVDEHLGIKPLHVLGEAPRVADRRITKSRSHVASRVQEMVWGIGQADRQGYVFFESLAYQFAEPCGMQDGGAGSGYPTVSGESDHRDPRPDRLGCSCATVVR